MSNPFIVIRNLNLKKNVLVILHPPLICMPVIISAVQGELLCLIVKLASNTKYTRSLLYSAHLSSNVSFNIVRHKEAWKKNIYMQSRIEKLKVSGYHPLYCHHWAPVSAQNTNALKL